MINVFICLWGHGYLKGNAPQLVLDMSRFLKRQEMQLLTKFMRNFCDLYKPQKFHVHLDIASKLQDYPFH